MPRFSLHAVGRDRPGIVAVVSQALANLGCNLEDSRMNILHGQFAIMLVLDAPGVHSGGAIEEALTPAIEELGLQLLVCPVPEPDTAPPPTAFLEIVMRGADHPGLVAKVAAEIAGEGGNIIELIGHVADEEGPTSSFLSLRAGLPSGAEAKALRDTLIRFAGDLDTNCEITEVDADQLSGPRL